MDLKNPQQQRKTSDATCDRTLPNLNERYNGKGSNILVYYCACSHGGIADYAHQQAEAIASSGWRVLMLCPTDYPHEPIRYQQDRCLPGTQNRNPFKAVRLLKLVGHLLSCYKILDRRIRETGSQRVLLATYSEYLAPLWAWRLRRLRRSGVVFGAIAHDPVRDFVVGPKWWHTWSISHGYSFLDHVFVHEAIEIDTGVPKQNVKVTIVPHGYYPFPEPTRKRLEVRDKLGIPHDAKLFLSFGHLRDGKNLSKILQALVDVQTAWLLVAGTEAGTGNTKSSEFMKLAKEMGVAARCRWHIDYVPPEVAADFFEAADYVLLTYSSQFRSASGVLNVAARYRKPVVASCGPGNLATTVRQYSLGIYVEPDRVNEITRGMQQICKFPPIPEWDRYASENSWELNAERVVRAFGM
jgi:glycosyltransferase involved in cell wall biosynthesis